MTSHDQASEGERRATASMPRGKDRRPTRWRVSCWAAIAACLLAPGWTGCGGQAKAASTTASAAPALPDPCDGYMRSVGSFLLRFEGALEGYQADRANGEATARADAAREMADFVHRELPDMRRVRARDARLTAAHGELVGSLEQLVGALEQLSTAYVLDDRRLRIRALDRVDLAWRRWSDAGIAIHGMCAPDDDDASVADAAR